MASLALALGLSDVVQERSGGIQLDTLFIDEGFGSLDQESLQLAINTLVDLQATGRTIGIISHVSELKEQMAQRIDVTGSRNGSTIRVIA
jgi:exonuclease SbcC